MNTQDRIVQQDNEQMALRIANVEAAREHMAECATAYTVDGNNANYEALQKAIEDYQQVLAKCAWDITALWRAGYRLTR